MSLLDDWIVYCSDPEGSRLSLPSPLPVDRTGDLIEQAERHGVLGALLKNFTSLESDPAMASFHEMARGRNRANAAFSILLGHEADALVKRMRGLPAAVVKGPVFARKLYPVSSLRSFADIDILADEEAVPRLSELLVTHGFRLAERHRHEDKWVHHSNDRLMVEVQTDLVHAVSLHGAMSLTYQRIAAAPESPAAMLLVAVVHGGAHQYERLQHLVDICQAARKLQGDAEQRRFEEMVVASNACLVAGAGLSLAGQIFGEPRCLELANVFQQVRSLRTAELLLGQKTVLSTMDKRRMFYRWRRLAFRLMIRWSHP